MAQNQSQKELQEQLNRARMEKERLENQLSNTRSGKKKACLIIVGLIMLFCWIMTESAMKGAPAELKSKVFWTSAILVSGIACLFVLFLTYKGANEIEEKANLAASEVRRIERELEKVSAKIQLDEAEQKQQALEEKLKCDEDHLNYLQAFCTIFSSIGVNNTADVIAPAREAVNCSRDAVAAGKSEIATLRRKV